MFWIFVFFFSWIDYLIWFGEEYSGTIGGVPYWFIKLTHWGVALQLVQLSFAAFTTYKAQAAKRAAQSGPCPWYASVAWFSSTAALAVVFFIFLLFWLLVWSPGRKVYVITFFTHGANIIVAMLDFFATNQPYYLRHVFAPMAFSTLYIAFTAFYYAVGGTIEDGSPTIYSVLDWSKPGSAIILSVGIILVAMPLVYALTFLAAIARARCKRAQEECDSSRTVQVKEEDCDSARAVEAKEEAGTPV